MVRWMFVMLVIGGSAACPDTDAEGERRCIEAGGACTIFADCEVGEGFIAGGGLDELNCGDSYSLCCLAECGGATEDIECSDGSATFRPTCAEDTLSCPDGMMEQPL